MNLSCFSLFFYMIFAKTSMNEYGIKALDLCLFRTFSAFVVSFLIAYYSRINFTVDKSQHKALWLRSSFGTLGFTTFVFGMKYLPLGIHMILFNTAPFQASLLGWLILHEKPKISELICMLISFVGILIIGLAKPIDSLENAKWIGISCSLCVSVCYALVSVLTRQMQQVHFSLILFYYAIFSCIVLSSILISEALIMGETMSLLNLSWI